MQEMPKAKNHTVMLDNRGKLVMTGTEDVSGFNEETVSVKTSCGCLVIKGENLHIDKLNLEVGVILELTFAQQSTAFLCSLVFGAAAGLLYDIFKIIRMTLCKGKASVFVTDFLYVFIVSLNLFIFSVAYMLGFFD